MNPMNVIFDNQISYMPGYGNNPVPYNMGFPIPGIPMVGNPPSWGNQPPYYTSMFTDYFYYWKLKQDCSAASVIYNNTDLSNFYFAVKQSITFDGNLSNITIP